MDPRGWGRGARRAANPRRGTVIGASPAGAIQRGCRQRWPGIPVTTGVRAAAPAIARLPWRPPSTRSDASRSAARHPPSTQWMARMGTRCALDKLAIRWLTDLSEVGRLLPQAAPLARRRRVGPARCWNQH